MTEIEKLIGCTGAEFNRMMTSPVVSLIVDEENLITAASQRKQGHLKTLAEQGNEVVVYGLFDDVSYCDIRVYAPGTRTEDDGDDMHLIVTGLDYELAMALYETDETGNVVQA